MYLAINLEHSSSIAAFSVSAFFMVDESLLFCCVKVQAVIFPIIGIRAWERRAEKKIILSVKKQGKKPKGKGIPYLALPIVLTNSL